LNQANHENAWCLLNGEKIFTKRAPVIDALNRNQTATFPDVEHALLLLAVKARESHFRNGLPFRSGAEKQYWVDCSKYWTTTPVSRAGCFLQSGVSHWRKQSGKLARWSQAEHGYATQERLYIMSIKEVLEELPEMSWEERQQIRTRLDSEDFRIGDASLSASQILDRSFTEVIVAPIKRTRPAGYLSRIFYVTISEFL
jgi:hypothetical protein